ncbi:dihydrodipicolinate synthase family protein [Paracoccus albus]|uniref:dihydrodipicolinate synthase family protein n=1 Tax=Paracoccus albus TaxID=3017784 RepID=UPI0022F0841E|nr:dihydrodipicolinate synthase family protein [Paracoccus albus]WBU61721.1 dihydrodipicolinate synthase family protein [Paracoccus albus]
MLNLPDQDGTLAPFAITREPLVPRAPQREWTRTAFAAAHVVSDPLAERSPWTDRPAVDWEATLNFRRSLWNQGLGLAEAMDTAQRGMGVDWETARELIARTMAEAKSHPLKPRVACGAGTDHRMLSDLPDLDAIIAAYEHQMEAIEAEGGQLILMATRALPAIGAVPDDYRRVYDRLITQAKDPVILHWLGDMFDPALKGYWGSADIAAASDAVIDLIAAHPGKVDGIKISLLDQAHEESFRARLPDGVKLYTGDDFNYAALIAGDGTHHSHALLGAFTAIAPAAAQALDALAAGDRASYDALMGPTIPLSRELFRAPTQFYKAGIAFLSWLNGMQPAFMMPAGFQSSRPITHYADLFRLAAAAGLLNEPDLAMNRMRKLLAVYGIEA